MLFHPPYMDIIKFTDNPNDLSQIFNLQTFINAFVGVCKNTLQYLANNRYFALVIGDVYKNSEVIPLSFYLMDSIKRNFKTKLKGIIVKNIEGNKGKLGKNEIWTYRALKSDYYLFKHEYIFVFKKEFRMATTHVLIVNETTFEVHLKYMFVGTGSNNDNVDFNNCSEIKVTSYN